MICAGSVIRVALLRSFARAKRAVPNELNLPAMECRYRKEGHMPQLKGPVPQAQAKKEGPMPQLVKQRRSGWAVLAVGALIASIFAAGAGSVSAQPGSTDRLRPAGPQSGIRREVVCVCGRCWHSRTDVHRRETRTASTLIPSTVSPTTGSLSARATARTRPASMCPPSRCGCSCSGPPI